MTEVSKQAGASGHDEAERERLLVEQLPQVRYIARRIHDRLRLPLVREVDDELAEYVDLDVREIRERVVQELHALLDREHRLLVVRVADDTDDDAVEDARRARDHVEMPVGDGVVRAGADRGDHGRS